METRRHSIRWEKVNIFISSTFNDMHAERDYLVKQVFPRLNEWCERRKLRLMETDLRWGVTEQDATHNRNVVNVCLNRIDECRPFFICFLGQRYGWVPRLEDISDETFTQFPGLKEAVADQCSVTELEVLHALVAPFHSEKTRREKGYHPAECSFFYFRDPSYLAHLPAEPAYLRRVYADVYADEAETDPAKKSFLIDQIPGTGRPIRPYEATWSNDARSPELEIPLQCPATLPENIERWRKQWKEVTDVDVAGQNVAENPDEAAKARGFNQKLTTGRLVGFDCRGESLGDVILRDLQEAIVTRFPDHVEVEHEDDLQKEVDQQEQFLFLNNEGFIERGDDFVELDRYVDSDSNKLLVLTAPGGMGKSTLLANWVDRHRTRIAGHPNQSIHVRFIGASDGSTTVYSLLRFLLREIKEIADKFDEEIPDDPLKLRAAWPQLLETIGKRGKTIIVIDALNQLESGLSNLTWLPRLVPHNIKLVVSFRRDEQAAEELYQRLKDSGQVILSEVRPFEKDDDRRRLVQMYLSQYLKELDEQHLEILIGSPGAVNPLYLKVVLSELRVFGAFANLGAKIRSDFGDTPISAFQGVLHRLENDPAYSPIAPQQVVPLLFSLLAHARHGLSANELISLFVQVLDLEDNSGSWEIAADTVHLFLRQVRPFLARREGRYDFFFESFKIAVQESYVAKSSEDSVLKRLSKDWHQPLAEYFKSLPTWREATVSIGAEYPALTKQPMRRKVSELPYHQTCAEAWKELQETLCDLTFIEAKCCDSQNSRAEEPGQRYAGVFRVLEDFDLAIARLELTHKTEAESTLLDRLRVLREQIWTEASILSARPDCAVQQLANRLRWSSLADAYLRTQADRAVRQCLAEGRGILTSLLPDTQVITQAQRVQEFGEDIIAVNYMTEGYVLWSRNGSWRIVDELGYEQHSGGALGIRPQQVAVGGRVVVFVLGRSVRYWLEWPDVEAQILTLPFLPQHVALSAQGERLLAVGPAGQWVRFGLTSATFTFLDEGRIEAQPMCCTLDSSGEKWAVGTLAGAVFYGDGHQLEITAWHSRMVRACAISPNNQIIASGGQDGNLRLTSSNGAEICQKPCGGWVNDLAFTTTGDKLFAVTEDGKILVLPIEGGKGNLETWAQEQAALMRICLNRTGRGAAILGVDYRVRLMTRPKSPTASGEPNFSGIVKYLDHQESNQTLLAVDSTGQTCSFHLQSSPLKGEPLLGSSGSILAAATIGRQEELIMVYNDMGAAKVVQLRLDKAPARKVAWPKKSWWQLRARRTYCTAAAFSPDKQTLILARAEGVNAFAGTILEIYDTKLWKYLFRFVLQEWITVLAIANHAERILVGFSDFTLAPRLLEPSRTAEKSRAIPLNGCLQAAMSADGQTLVIIDRDHNAWLTQGSLEHQSFRLMGRNIACCNLSLDGTWLLLCDHDGGVALTSLVEQKSGLQNQRIFRAGLTWTPSYCKFDPTSHNVLLGGQKAIQVFHLNQIDQ